MNSHMRYSNPNQRAAWTVSAAYVQLSFNTLSQRLSCCNIVHDVGRFSLVKGCFLNVTWTLLQLRDGPTQRAEVNVIASAVEVPPRPGIAGRDEG